MANAKGAITTEWREVYWQPAEKEEACMPFKSKVEKLCANCKFYETSIGDSPCRECMAGQRLGSGEIVDGWRSAYWQPVEGKQEETCQEEPIAEPIAEPVIKFSFTKGISKGISKKKEDN